MTSKSLNGCLVGWRDGSSTSDEFLACVEQLHLTEAEIATALTSAFSIRDWSSLQALVIVCYERPSAIYAPTLCQILDEASEDMTNEDVVDVLDMIHEPSTVAALRRAADYDLPADEFHHLNRKCVYALGHIGTPEAEVALNEIAERIPYAEVKAAALQVLQFKKAGGS